MVRIPPSSRLVLVREHRAQVGVERGPPIGRERGVQGHQRPEVLDEEVRRPVAGVPLVEDVVLGELRLERREHLAHVVGGRPTAADADSLGRRRRVRADGAEQWPGEADQRPGREADGAAQACRPARAPGPPGDGSARTVAERREHAVEARVRERERLGVPRPPTRSRRPRPPRGGGRRRTTSSVRSTPTTSAPRCAAGMATLLPEPVPTSSTRMPGSIPTRSSSRGPTALIFSATASQSPADHTARLRSCSSLIDRL